MLVEELLGSFHLFLIDEAHMAEAAIGKLVYDGLSKPKGEIIVDERTDNGSYGCKQDD